MTLAFSTKSGQWTTEYSFEPTCYANTDGRMIAFKDESGGSFWLHDEKESERNKYYGTAYKSRMSMVSNEDPSATKSYEAISLETSYENWNIDVATLEQEGVVGTLYERENDQYAPIPKDGRISTSNMVYIGTTSGTDFFNNLVAGSIPMTSLSGDITTGMLCVQNVAGNLRSFNPDSGNAGDPGARDQNVIDSNTGILNTPGQRVLVSEVSEASRSLILTDAPDLISAYTQSGLILLDSVNVFVADGDSGESMKGDYLVVNIETVSNGPSPFELYAINVDQHKVNLDHSLGQNN